MDRTLFLSNLAAVADSTAVNGLLKTNGAGAVDATLNLQPTSIVVSGAGYNTPAALTDAATIAWDWSTAQSAMVTLTANRILGNPTNAVSGQYAAIRVNRSGAFQLSFDTLFKGITGLSQSTTSGAIDHFVFRYNGTNFELVGAKSNVGA